jgi:arylsulfatase A-like enzyme
MLAGYYAHCSALDECIGELQRTLKEQGLEQNTLLMFTADHGDMLGSHGGRNKQQPYDESIRVPLLLHWPAALGTTPRKLEAPFNSEDFMPTILGFCGVAIPPSVEGLDYSSYARGGSNPSDGATVISCAAPFSQWSRRNGGREFRGLRTTRYTYVRDLNGPWLLFDNQTDPGQMTNLIGKAESAALQGELDATLKRKLAAAHDEFLPAADYIQKWNYKVNQEGSIPYEN